MINDVSIRKENAKMRIREINQRWSSVVYRDYAQREVFTEFFGPLLDAFGWNTKDPDEAKMEVNRIDHVLYVAGKPYLGIEVKYMDFGPISMDKDNVRRNVDRLLRRAREVGLKFAVMTRFVETFIFDVSTGKELMSFTYPNEYLTKFSDLWKYLSKPSSNNICS